MSLRQILRYKGNSEASQCGVQNVEDAVKHELAFDPDLELAFSFRELPRVQSTIRGETQIYATVTDQLLRRLGN